MLAKYEKRKYEGNELVWVGTYKNLHNISHWHFEHEIIACQSGTVNIMIDNRLFHIQKSQCILCPGGSVHYIDAGEDCIVLVSLLDQSIVKNITERYELRTPVFADLYNTTERLAAIHDELQRKPKFFADKANSMISDLIIDIFRNEELADRKYDNSGLTRYKMLLSKIDVEYESISFRAAADFMNLSETYFSRYFKKMSGITFSKYLNIVRIEKAIEILSTVANIPITELMLKCGFNTLRNFNRTFKEITGYSPKSLPFGFSLNIRSLPIMQGAFDPTLENSILL